MTKVPFVRIIAHVRESNAIEGIHRAPNTAELDATEAFLALPRLTITDLRVLVSTYQPDAVLRDREDLNVRVGQYIAPRGGPEVVAELEAILREVHAFHDPSRCAYLIHQRYETLHPFTDGNGRSGRAIWLWQTRETRLGFLQLESLKGTPTR